MSQLGCHTSHIREVNSQSLLLSPIRVWLFCPPGKHRHCVVWLFCPLRAAMAAPALYVMEGTMLDAFHTVYRVSLDVAAAQAANECCACGRSHDHSYSDGGATDYRRTAVCEYCFDVLHDAAATTAQKTDQCNKLTADGCEIARQWIAFSRSRRRLLFAEADFRRAVELTLGIQRLPNARR